MTQGMLSRFDTLIQDRVYQPFRRASVMNPISPIREESITQPTTVPIDNTGCDDDASESSDLEDDYNDDTGCDERSFEKEDAGTSSDSSGDEEDDDYDDYDEDDDYDDYDDYESDSDDDSSCSIIRTSSSTKKPRPPGYSIFIKCMRACPWLLTWLVIYLWKRRIRLDPVSIHIR